MRGHVSGSSIGNTVSCPRTPDASNTVIAVGRLFSARQPSLWASSTLTGLNATGELAIDVREEWKTCTRYGSALATTIRPSGSTVHRSRVANGGTEVRNGCTPRHTRSSATRPRHARPPCPTTATRLLAPRMGTPMWTAKHHVSPSCASSRSRRCATVPCVAAVRSVSSRALNDRARHPHELPRSNVSRVRSSGSAPRAAAQPGCIRSREMLGPSATHLLQRMRTTALIDAFAPRSSSPRRPERRATGQFRFVKSAPLD